MICQADYGISDLGLDLSFSQQFHEMGSWWAVDILLLLLFSLDRVIVFLSSMMIEVIPF